MAGTRDLRIRREGRGYCVVRGRQGRALIWIVPDGQYPGMWRVQRRDGSLSDMVNLARAQDAALGIALSIVNRKRESASGEAAHA